MLNKSEQDALEALIDGNDLGAVLESLAKICDEKAEHLQSNWQDGNSARIWTMRARAIEKLAARDLFK